MQMRGKYLHTFRVLGSQPGLERWAFIGWK